MATDKRYVETLRVPLAWWLLGGLFGLAVGWAFYVATPVSWAIAATAVGLATAFVILWRYGSAVVVVDDVGLTAGKAHLPWQHLGSVTPLDEGAARRAAGVEADARAFAVLRAYCRGAVKVGVVDDADPTPYWLVSTRRPDELARHLSARTVQD
ncbi:MAG: DUF3093 domain-containing protein [Nocardioidaceae bacterium]|jgi:hypothetical protein